MWPGKKRVEQVIVIRLVVWLLSCSYMSVCMREWELWEHSGGVDVVVASLAG